MDMKDSLRQSIDEFNKVTGEMIILLEQNKLETLDDLVSKRQGIIDTIHSYQYTKEEFNEACSGYKLEEQEKKLSILVEMRRNEAKMDLDNFIRSKNANRNYNSRSNISSVFLNKSY